MKIRFTTSLVGRDFVFGRGQEVVMPDSKAEYWVSRGVAVEVKDDEAEEKRPIDEPVVQEIRVPKKRPVRRKSNEV